MAEEVLVKEILTTEMIEGGRDLTKRLAKTELGVTASFWFYMTDNLRWNLMLGISQVLEEGTIKAYTIIQSELKDRPVRGVSFSDVVVLQSDHPVIRRLKRLTRASKGGAEVRVSRAVVENVFIDDAYIYNLSYRHKHAA